MQRVVATALILCLACNVTAITENPMGKVTQLLSELEAKIKAEGEAEEKAFKEFVDWCDESSRNTRFEIKTDTKEKEELEAAIAKAAAEIDSAETNIEELSGSIADAEGELKSATQVREKEIGEFKATEGELVDSVDTLDRAIAVLEREMAQNPALIQKINTANMNAVLQALTTVIDSAGFAANDRQKLVALVQDKQGNEDSDSDLEFGAPAAAAYKSHSTSIVDVLEDLKEKAEEELAEARKAESNSQHNFAMLKQSLEDQIAADSKDLDEAKSTKSSSSEAKANAEGDLELTVKALANAEAALETVTGDCQTMAADHEASMNSRAEELKALAKAKEILQSSTGGAVDQSYSLLQLAKSSSSTAAGVHSTLHTHADLVSIELVTIVKHLAKQHHSSALAQLASRIATVLRYGAADGEDPFAKVKALINELIEKLEAEGAQEASHKAYCDEEMKKTAEKKAELTADIEKLSTKIDKAAADAAKLKEEVATLQKELAELTKMQAEMDKVRSDEHSAFVTAKSDLEQGITGVQKALEVLRDYYGSTSLIQSEQPEMPAMHTKAEGAGSSIIGILEVCESDFSKTLAQDTVAEEEAQDTYDKVTQENKITKTMKEQDVKYKTAESKSLDKEISENTSDREGLQTELSAVLEYNDKLVEQCVAKPETYEERKKRREAEISGLKEALKYLEGEAFMQRHSSGRRLRHTPVH